ncbi:hypothetical protein M0R45_010110 [Rubus argutus]|uniref:Uncharacterized protein n=1 Tax=Rubus argutus TaxID=59490 RepID=A0AAW1Y8M3_RUBAR
MLVEGKVVKLTRGSISVIVLGFSCAFIKDEDIREEFKYKNKRGKESTVWMWKHCTYMMMHLQTGILRGEEKMRETFSYNNDQYIKKSKKHKTR